MGKMDEMIYAIEVDELFSGVNKFNKFIEMDTNILANIEEYTKIMKRGECENDPTIKHLIPYIFLTTPGNTVFVTRRTSKQTEERLHNKASIGVGGHVGEFSDSVDIYSNVLFGAIRELNEELNGVGIEALMGQQLNLKLMVLWLKFIILKGMNFFRVNCKDAVPQAVGFNKLINIL